MVSALSGAVPDAQNFRFVQAAGLLEQVQEPPPSRLRGASASTNPSTHMMAIESPETEALQCFAQDYAPLRQGKQEKRPEAVAARERALKRQVRPSGRIGHSNISLCRIVL